jgi:hypothetical protein
MMKIKLLILCILTIFKVSFVNAQVMKKELLLSDTKFEVFRRSLMTRPRPKLPGLFLETKLPQNVKNNFSKLSKATIMQLLADTATDWATNLLLYEKYDRDAYLFSTVIKTRKEWLPVKKSDIAYWKKKLK